MNITSKAELYQVLNSDFSFKRNWYLEPLYLEPLYVVLTLNCVTDKDLRKTRLMKFLFLETMLFIMIMVLLMTRSLTLAKLQSSMGILKNSLGGKPTCIVTSWV